MKRTLSILLTMAMIVTMVAGMLIPAAAETDFTYTIKNGSAVVTRYNGTAVDVTVPDTLGGSPVKTIGVSAFEGNTTIKSITLSSSVTLIDEGAFADCTSLTAVHLAQVATVAYGAFYGCTALTDVTYDGTPSAWSAVAIAAYNDPLTTANVTCLREVKSGSLLPDNIGDFRTLSEGGGTMNISVLDEGYRFYSKTGYPSAYTVPDPADYTTVDIFSDTYLNFDFTVANGYTNIILAFGGMDIVSLRTVGHYVTLNRLVDPSYVDEDGIIYDISDGTYRASVHVGALGCDPSLITDGKFDISGIKIYSVWGGTVTVRDLSVGDAKYPVMNLPQTSYTIKEKQSLLPASKSDFATAHTDTGMLLITKQDNGYRFRSSSGWPCAFTKHYQTGDGYILADPDDYLYYHFTVEEAAQAHLVVYFGGADPVDTVAGTYASLNPLIHPNYITAGGAVVDLNAGEHKGFIKIRDLNCDPSLMVDGKVPISDMKIFAVNKPEDLNSWTIIHELAVASIETYSLTPSTTTSTTTTTTTTTTTATTTTTQAAPITIALSTVGAAVGDTVTVDVTVSDNHYLINGQLVIDYDPTALALTAPVTEINTAILSESVFWAFGTPQDGKIKFAFAGSDTHASAVGGTLFSLTFTVLDRFEGISALRLSSPELCSAKDGADYEPAVTFTDGAVVRRGDINADGAISLVDAMQVFYHVNEKISLTDNKFIAADYNGDGEVTLADAMQVFYIVNERI